MKYDHDYYYLSSGRRIMANKHILGLSPSEDLTLFDGYDGVVGTAEDYTAEERKEIAEFMIGLWQTWGGL